VEAIRLSIHGESVHPTTESVAASPYYQLQANGPQGQAILILGKVQDGMLGWYGQGDDIVFTRKGLVVRTTGFPQNLSSTVPDAADPFDEGLQHVTSPTTYTRTVDWSPGYRGGIVMQATLSPGGSEDVEILGSVHHLRRYDERLSGAGGSFTNRYWVDPADGFIWKSRQYVAPGFPLELIQLRPYTGSADQPDTAVYPSTGRLAELAGAARVKPDAYVAGAAWLRPSLVPDQIRLKAGVVFELGVIRMDALSHDKDALGTDAATFQAWIMSLPVTGRRTSVVLDPAQLEVSPPDNLTTEPGDTLYYPVRPTEVRIVGAVAKPCRVPQVALQDARRYLAQCPPSKAADPDRIFVIQPDGAVFPQNIAAWNRDPPRVLAPGAWIYVPFNHTAIRGATDGQFNEDAAAFIATQRFDVEGTP
jgi:hypothetical protein